MYKPTVSYITCRHIYATNKGSVDVYLAITLIMTLTVGIEEIFQRQQCHNTMLCYFQHLVLFSKFQICNLHLRSIVKIKCTKNCPLNSVAMVTMILASPFNKGGGYHIHVTQLLSTRMS